MDDSADVGLFASVLIACFYNVTHTQLDTTSYKLR